MLQKENHYIFSLSSVDASAAGKGTLEIDSDLPILQYDSIGQRQYQITFVPKKVGVHELLIKYNGITVEGLCYNTINIWCQWF